MVNRCHVINAKHNKYDVYIGRPSKWGNSFEIGVNGCRSDVIRLYQEYLFSNKELMDDLQELKWTTLGCWCKPENCHGDVLVKLVNELEEQEIKEKREVIALNKNKEYYQVLCGEYGHEFEIINDKDDFFSSCVEKCRYCGMDKQK